MPDRRSAGSTYAYRHIVGKDARQRDIRIQPQTATRCLPQRRRQVIDLGDFRQDRDTPLIELGTLLSEAHFSRSPV